MFRLDLADVAWLTLDRPEARNAIPLDGWQVLAARIAEVGASDARLLVISGAGGAFCAGADLSDFRRLAENPDARIGFREGMRAAFDALPALAIPAIAMIDGPCYGAGVALALACDVRLATEAARFAITPAKIGISYPQEDVQRLVALVGTGQAARLLFTGAGIDAGEAARIGLVESVAADPKETIAQILANSCESIATLKRGIGLAGEGRSTDAAQDERFDALIGGAELRRRLGALRGRW
jgi:enoyl-CoA hydratase/carnithine racemase